MIKWRWPPYPRFRSHMKTDIFVLMGNGHLHTRGLTWYKTNERSNNYFNFLALTSESFTLILTFDIDQWSDKFTRGVEYLFKLWVTSVQTVVLLWAEAAHKGQGIKNALNGFLNVIFYCDNHRHAIRLALRASMYTFQPHYQNNDLIISYVFLIKSSNFRSFWVGCMKLYAKWKLLLDVSTLMVSRYNFTL